MREKARSERKISACATFHRGQCMAKGTSLQTTWAPRLLSVLRIVSAFLFMQHGTQKLFGFPGAEAPANLNLLSQVGIAGVLETFGGALLLLGIFTRPVAFILSGQMAAAYFL